MTRFEVITAIAAPPRRVFDLSLDVGLHTASMADSGERTRASQPDVIMRSGLLS